MSVYGDVNVAVRATNDKALVHIFVNSCSAVNRIVQEVGVSLYTSSLSEAETSNFAFSFLVGKGEQFQLTSEVAGTGVITLNNISRYYP